MSTGSARPLANAFRIAPADLVGWLGRDYGGAPARACQLLTQAGEAPVPNVCDPTTHSSASWPNVTSPAGHPTKTPRLRSQAGDYARAR